MPSNKPTIIVDTREKYPFDFERDNDFNEVIYQKLEAGDYTLEGLENIVVVERKKSVDELYNNVSTKLKFDRFVREFNRMPKYRFIVGEFTWEDIYSPSSYFINSRASKHKPRSKKQPIAIILPKLINFMANFNVHIIPAGLKAQAITKHILLYFYKENNLGFKNK